MHGADVLSRGGVKEAHVVFRWMTVDGVDNLVHGSKARNGVLMREVAAPRNKDMVGPVGLGVCANMCGVPLSQSPTILLLLPVLRLTFDIATTCRALISANVHPGRGHGGACATVARRGAASRLIIHYFVVSLQELLFVFFITVVAPVHFEHVRAEVIESTTLGCAAEAIVIMHDRGEEQRGVA
jgi:hypothetical protein